MSDCQPAGTLMNKDCICDLDVEQIGAGGTHLVPRDAPEPADRLGIVIDERADESARIDDDVRSDGGGPDPRG
jgi:hypothetical protein